MTPEQQPVQEVQDQRRQALQSEIEFLRFQIQEK